MILKDKLFSIKEEGKRYVLTILGLKIKLIKNGYDFKSWNFRYLRCKIYKLINPNYDVPTNYVLKYRYAIDLAHKELENIPKEEINQLTGKFWTMWLQDDIPESMQMCLNTIKYFYPDITIITEKNMNEFVDIPDYIYEKYKKGIIMPAHFSDYIRMCLLDKYGGTWLDASLLMLDKIPEFILKQPFFVLQSRDKKLISNFFIHSGKNNFLVKTMKIYLEEYWKHENIAIHYFFFHSFFNSIIQTDPTCKKIYQNIIPYLNSIVLYLADNGKRADEDTWNYLSKSCFMYKFHRRNKVAVKNPNSWYNFLLNKYRKGELLSNMNSTAV